MGEEALDMLKFIGKKMKVLKQLPKKLLDAGKKRIMKPFGSSEYTKIFSKNAKGLDKLGSVFMVAGVTVSALAANTAVDVTVGSTIGFGIGYFANKFVNEKKIYGHSITEHIKSFVTNTYKTK